MKRVMILTIAAMLVSMTVVSAQPCIGGRGCCDRAGWNHPGKPGPGHGMGMPDGHDGQMMILKHADEIGLTDAQKEKLEQMIVDFNLEKVDLQAELKKAKIKLQALLRKEDARETEVYTAIDDATRLKAELHKMRYRHHKAIRNLLTDKQIDRLKELRKERREKMRGPHPGMGPGGPGFGFDFDPESDI
ncbi:MAG: Spy/CpxP family protein refolding chaperone [Candidatus Zixiibacteriota bacterium]